MSTWTKCSEKRIPENQEVLVFFTRPDGKGWMDVSIYWWKVVDGSLPDQPSHWMPLPEPPTE